MSRRAHGRADAVFKPIAEELPNCLADGVYRKPLRMIGARLEQRILNFRGRPTVDVLATAPSTFPTEIKLCTPSAIRTLKN